MQRNWEDQHKVTEELVEGPPSRRANATLTPCPAGNYLWCIGGEFFSEDKKAVRKFTKAQRFIHALPTVFLQRRLSLFARQSTHALLLIALSG